MADKMVKNLQSLKTNGIYVAVYYTDCVENAMICDASSKQEVIRNMLELYKPNNHKTYVVELDVYNVKHRELYDNITDIMVVLHNITHDGGARRIHRKTYAIHPIPTQCTGKNILDHKYKFIEMTRDKKDNRIFREICMDCDQEKTTVTGLETDYGNGYYSIEYMDAFQIKNKDEDE